LDNGNIDDAVSILSTMSDKAKKTTSYSNYMAICYEKGGDYDNAILIYKNIYKTTKSDKSLKAVARCENIKMAQQKKQAQIKNCFKCKGTGYYEAMLECNYCNGAGKSKENCDICYGKGTVHCKDCKGKGWETGLSMLKSMNDVLAGTNPNKEVRKVACTSCKGTGKIKCNTCESTGKVDKECNYCKGTGSLKKQIKCPLHE